jgi:hypothetical protein
LLPTTVALHDIDDVEGFVAATIERAGLGGLPKDEKEDLIADGIVILYTLAERFEPHRPGYAQAGRFSGFAAQFLPRRLGDAWHSKHPEHIRVVGEDGKRYWVYRERPISLDQYLTPNGESARSPEVGVPGGSESRIRPTSHQAPVPLPA